MQGRVTAILFALIIILMMPTQAAAMELKVVGNQLILSGPVVGDEPDKVREALASSPGVDTVILRNSGGGNAPAGYQVGQLLRKRCEWLSSRANFRYLQGQRPKAAQRQPAPDGDRVQCSPNPGMLA